MLTRTLLVISTVLVFSFSASAQIFRVAEMSADRGFRVIVASDACTEMSEEMHDAALFTFGYVFGRVRTTEEISNCSLMKNHTRKGKALSLRVCYSVKLFPL